MGYMSFRGWKFFVIEMKLKG